MRYSQHAPHHHLAVLACSKVTKSRYQKVQGNMSYAEVIKILGEPDSSESACVGPMSATTAKWYGPEGTVSIQFVNDKVKLRRFTDVQTGGADSD